MIELTTTIGNYTVKVEGDTQIDVWDKMSEMAEILFKIPSLNREARAKDTRIINFTESLKERYADQRKCFAKKPDGQYFTRQDLLNYKEHFDVS